MRRAMRKFPIRKSAAALLVGAWAMAWSLLSTAEPRAETIATISPAGLSGCSIVVDRTTNVAAGTGSALRFPTIQGAVDAARPGDVVCVGVGDHEDERVAVTRSGTAKAPIRIRALGEVKTAGFVVDADHVAIEGFTISNRGRGDDQDGRAMGIYLSGTGLKVLGNTAIDTEGDGIGCDTNPPSCVDVVISHNTVRGADGAGIIVAGRRILVEGNDVSRSVRIKSTDADGMRFFGSDITIRGNYVHDISDREYPPGQNPHTDCFQTFDISKPVTTAVVIEDNICKNVDHQCLIAGGLEKGKSGFIKFRNNICGNNGSQALLIQRFPSVEVANNLFLPSIRYFGVRLESGSTKAVIANNAFLGALRPYLIDDASEAGLKADYNLVDNPNQPTPPSWWKEPHGQWGVDPGLVDASGASGFAAYRPAPGSPLIDAGSNEYNASPTDLDGNLRVVDGDGDGMAKIDIGPYEFQRH
jgi:Right handed beta helix region